MPNATPLQKKSPYSCAAENYRDSPDNWVHIYEERYMQYIRMQNKQMIICENISGSAGDPHWRLASSHASC